MILLVTVVVGGLFVLFNWRNAGATKSVNCNDYPDYCVPLAGGSAEHEDLEAAGVRSLDADSRGVEGVVRYVDDNVVTMGNPAAPIHFRTVMDYACSHCNTYHTGELHRFIQDYVMTGQATVGFVLTTGTGGQNSALASQAALCAGEQGGFWEMGDEFFRLARSQGVGSGFSVAQIRSSADRMGLDADDLMQCVSSSRYQLWLNDYVQFANDWGVTGTPTLLVSYGNDTWSKVDRSYGSMVQMTEQANAAQ